MVTEHVPAVQAPSAADSALTFLMGPRTSSTGTQHQNIYIRKKVKMHKMSHSHS